MQQGGFDLDDSVAILERTPASLNALLAGLPERWLDATEGDGTWSPREVVGHLVHGERANWLPRARHLLAGAPGPFEPFDRLGQRGDGQNQGMTERLATFARLRGENIAALKAMRLTKADLDRTGHHPELGEVRLRQLLATWVVHDLDHLGQIARTMAKAYRGAVGPWSAYLTILRDREK